MAVVFLSGCSESSSKYHNLGVDAYSEGNFEKAAEYLAKSAELGDQDSQALLGSMYILGHGVPEDRERARMLLYPAAESGHAHAEMFMGVLYFTGEGTEHDIKEARYWLQLAANKGIDRAAQLLTELPPE